MIAVVNSYTVVALVGGIAIGIGLSVLYGVFRSARRIDKATTGADDAPANAGRATVVATDATDAGDAGDVTDADDVTDATDVTEDRPGRIAPHDHEDHAAGDRGTAPVPGSAGGAQSDGGTDAQAATLDAPRR